jgi:hypothetical protein
MELVQPAMAVVLPPSFFEATSTTAFGCNRKKGLAPENQDSV